MPNGKVLGGGQPIKERPHSRDLIVRGEFIPDIVRHRDTLFWDGFTARTRDGRRHVLSYPLGIELKRLAKEGLWGDLSGTVLDWFRYSRLRDVIEGKGRPGEFLDVALWQPPERGAGRRAVARS